MRLCAWDTSHFLGTALSINLPNFITLGRVISVPFIFWLLLTGQAKAAFLLFVAAGISDAVDGFLAKRYQMQTALGAYLDPLADKLLIVSIYVALGAREQLPLGWSSLWSAAMLPFWQRCYCRGCWIIPWSSSRYL